MTIAMAAALALLLSAVVWRRERSIRDWPSARGDVLFSIPEKRPVRPPLYRTTVRYLVRDVPIQAVFTLRSHRSSGTTLALRYNPNEPSDAVLKHGRYASAAPAAALLWVVVVFLCVSALS